MVVHFHQLHSPILYISPYDFHLTFITSSPHLIRLNSYTSQPVWHSSWANPQRKARGSSPSQHRYSFSIQRALFADSEIYYGEDGCYQKETSKRPQILCTCRKAYQETSALL
jgi:hypothetical protein